MAGNTQTIGHLAQAAEVNVETVRYYQRVGLVKEPDKPASGYRQYPPETVERIRFIRRAQKLGFSLAEISELLELGEGHCEDVRQRAEHKRKMIEGQIADLKAMRGSLDELITACDESEKAHCPIIKTLTSRK